MILNGDDTKVGHGATEGLQRNVSSEDVGNAPSRNHQGQPLRISPDLERYFHESPREIFAAFDGVAGNMTPGGKDETLAFGYLFVLQGLLQELRHRMDRGYADATALVADFQAMVARQERAVAKALAEGVDLGEIGLMHEVASQTVDVVGT